MPKVTRRQFVAGSSAALIGLGMKSGRRIEGGFVNDSFALGHLLRDRAGFPLTKQKIRMPIVIVGGGIAGLSAAWHLERSGFRDFVLLEMEQQPGGNSRWGENEVSAYPWAAHYVPIPNKKAIMVRELFRELGVMDAAGNFEERYLCHSPQERLFIHGRWQEGIEPALGGSARDHEDSKRFHAMMRVLRAREWFTIPLEEGLQKHGRQTASFDRISMAQWMRQNRFQSPYLRWYVDYACRDDYGASIEDTSAWAGLHYFASREDDETGPLTWPEGNGWVAKRLITKLDAFIRRGAMVHRVEKHGLRYRVLAGDTEYSCEAVVFAAPTFLAPYIIAGFPPAQTVGFQYSPWLTANLTLARLPQERHSEPAWDNVIYDSPSLGYVVANHQQIRRYQDRAVWTYYRALTHGAPKQVRQELLTRDAEYWKEAILADLERAHKDIRECVQRIDIMRMGHAMVRPAVGFISDPRRHKMGQGTGSIFFGNSDLSGISIFEEAQYRGVEAARKALRTVSKA